MSTYDPEAAVNGLLDQLPANANELRITHIEAVIETRQGLVAEQDAIIARECELFDQLQERGFVGETTLGEVATVAERDELTALGRRQLRLENAMKWLDEWDHESGMAALAGVEDSVRPLPTIDEDRDGNLYTLLPPEGED